MKISGIPVILAGVLLLGGCATKKYVAQQVDPIRGKADQLSTAEDQTQKQLATTDTKLSATDEVARAADARSTDALTRADAASQKVDQAKTELRGEMQKALGDTVASLDDYKPAGDATVNFKLNSAKLSAENKAQLDQLVSVRLTSLKRYFIAIEGYTDRSGSAEHNLELSRRRAEAVQTYLVAQYSIPVYRIQIVGLGKEKPADEGKGREARARNRRVELTIFSADNAVPAQNRSGAGAQ